MGGGPICSENLFFNTANFSDGMIIIIMTLVMIICKFLPKISISLHRYSYNCCRLKCVSAIMYSVTNLNEARSPRAGLEWYEASLWVSSLRLQVPRSSWSFYIQTFFFLKTVWLDFDKRWLFRKFDWFCSCVGELNLWHQRFYPRAAAWLVDWAIGCVQVQI